MKLIYHGTIQKNLRVIKPFKRYTPGGEALADSIQPRVYATYDPAYAVAHSFPWSSDDGVDISVQDNMVTLLVPKDKQKVLEQPVCIYILPDDTFSHTQEEETGLTYHSLQEVVPVDCECFNSVTTAMQRYSGRIKFI